MSIKIFLNVCSVVYSIGVEEAIEFQSNQQVIIWQNIKVLPHWGQHCESLSLQRSLSARRGRRVASLETCYLSPGIILTLIYVLYRTGNGRTK